MTVFLETILSFLAALCKPIEGKAQGIGFWGEKLFPVLERSTRLHTGIGKGCDPDINVNSHIACLNCDSEQVIKCMNKL